MKNTLLCIVGDLPAAIFNPPERCLNTPKIVTIIHNQISVSVSHIYEIKFCGELSRSGPFTRRLLRIVYRVCCFILPFFIHFHSCFPSMKNLLNDHELNGNYNGGTSIFKTVPVDESSGDSFLRLQHP